MTKRAICFDELCPSVADFRNHIRLTTDALDGELQDKLMAAVRAAEHFIGKLIAPSLITYTVSFVRSLTLPEGPIIEVLGVKVDGEETSSYTRDGRVITFSDDVAGSEVEVIYKAGMEREGFEYDIRAAILLHAAALLNNPVDSVETLPKASTNLLRPYRSWHDGDNY